MKNLITFAVASMTILPGMAQEESTKVIVSHGDPICDINQLASGQKVILFDNTTAPNQSGCLFEKEDNQYIDMTKNRPIDRSVGSEKYVWEVTRTASGYSFKSVTGQYIKFKENSKSVQTDREQGFFTISPNGSSGYEWSIKVYNTNSYFNSLTVGQAGKAGAFCFWTGAHPYVIYPVETKEITQSQKHTVTVETYVNGNKVDTYNNQVYEGNINLYDHPRNGAVLSEVKVDNKTVDKNEPVNITGATTIRYYYLSNATAIGISDDTEDVQWHTLKINGKYAQYQSTASNNEPDGCIQLLSNLGKIENKHLFAFVKSGGDNTTYKIYNKEAGLTKPLTYNNTNNETVPVFQDESARSASSLWKIDNRNGFCFLKAATNNASLNDFADRGTVKFYNQDVNGGKCIPFNKTKDELDQLISKSNCVGAGAMTDEVEQHITKNDLNEAIEAIKKGSSKNQIKTGGFYRIQNYARKHSTGNDNQQGNGGYLEYKDVKEFPNLANAIFFANDPSDQRANAIWSFEKAEENNKAAGELKYYLKNLNSGKYLMTAENEAKVAFTVHPMAADNGYGQCYIQKAGDANQYLHVTGKSVADKGNVVYNGDHSANGPSAWYVSEVNTFPILISSAGYKTMNLPFSVKIPKECTAYYAPKSQVHTTEGSSQYVVLQKIDGPTLPANTAVILEGPSGNYDLEMVSENNSGTETKITNDENMLQGTNLTVDVPDDENAYILVNRSDETCFVQLKQGNDKTRYIGQNKSYLKLGEKANAIKQFSIEFDEDGTTGIEAPTAATDKKDVKFYDLQGRRVMNPKKGLYVTSEGKKVLFY